MIGKWDVGHYAKAYVPTQRGFDGFFGYYSACVVGRCFLLLLLARGDSPNERRSPSAHARTLLRVASASACVTRWTGGENPTTPLPSAAKKWAAAAASRALKFVVI